MKTKGFAVLLARCFLLLLKALFIDSVHVYSFHLPPPSLLFLTVHYRVDTLITEFFNLAMPMVSHHFLIAFFFLMSVWRINDGLLATLSFLLSFRTIFF